MVFHHIASLFHNLRFHTTLHWHHKATKYKWYKRWHDFKYAHHFHAFLFGVYFLSLIASLISPMAPQAYAANGTWTQTSFNGSSDGIYTNTAVANSGADIGLVSGKSGLSNAGGGTWSYKKPVTISNSGGALTDYQVLLDSERNVVGDWHFDEGTGSTINDSSGTVNGTASGTSYWAGSGNGKFGNAFLGSGDDFVTLNSTSLYPANITVEAWVKVNTMDTYMDLVSRDYAAGRQYKLSIENSIPRFYLFTSNSTYASAYATTITTGTWYHIVGTFDGSNVKIYVNNTAGTPAALSGSTNQTSGGTTQIGRWSYDNTRYFKGNIDEVRIYNKALSETEITSRYSGYENDIYTRAKTDGSDIRFTDQGGVTELNYWYESFNNTNSIKNYKIWVKVPSVSATGNTTINMYYGNTSATSSVNGANTFEFFENNQGYSDGQANPGGWSLTTTTGGAGSTYYVRATNKASSMNLDVGGSDPTCDANVNFVVLAQKGINLGSGNYQLNYKYMSYYQSYSNTQAVESWVDSTALQNSSPEAGSNLSTHWANNIYHKYSNTFTGPKTNLKLGGHFSPLSCGAPMYMFDDIFIRKYSASDPTSALGSENPAGFASSGSYVTNVITPTNLYGNWGLLNFSTVLNGQTATVDVLNGTNDALISSNVASGTNLNLSTSTYPSLKLRVNFSTADSAVTPLLNNWDLAYQYDITGPTAPASLTFSSLTKDSVTINWLASADSESGLANPAYFIERAPDNSGVAGVYVQVGTVNNNTYNELNLLPNSKYWFRVRSRDMVGNYSNYSSESSIVTLTNAPALNQPASTTNDNRPLITNTSSPDMSFANQEVRLYNNTTEIARTKANSSGVVSFGDNKAANNSFEVDSDNNGRADSWNPWQNLLPPVTTTMSNDAQDGVRAQRIQVSGTATSASGHLTTYTTTVGNHAPGQSATVSFWIKGSVSGANVRIQIDAATAGGSYISGVGGPDITVNQNYTRYTHTYTNLPPNTSRVTAIINVRNFDTGDNVDLYVDNAKIDNYNQNLSDGTYNQLNAKAVNSAGQTILNSTPTANVSAYLSTASANVSTTIDTVLATTSLVSSPGSPDGQNGYFVTNPIISLSTNESGLIQYKWDNAENFSLYTAPLNMNTMVGQGTHTLYYRAIDYAGNIEQTKSMVYKLDSVAPTGSIEFVDGEWLVNNPVVLNLTASDGTSGMSQMQFSNDGITYTSPENFVSSKTWNLADELYGGNSNDSTKTIYVKFIDNAGNVSSPATDTAVLDRVAPTNPNATVVASPNDPVDSWYNDVTPQFTLENASDVTSGVAGYYIYFGTNQSADPLVDGDYQTENSYSPTILSEDSGMTFYLRVRTRDNAGNIIFENDPASYTLFTYKIDITKPNKVTFVTPNPAGWSAINSFSFDWPESDDPLVNSAASGLKGYEYMRQNDSDWTFTTDTAASSIQSYQTGVNIFLIRVVDLAENRSDEIPVNYYYSGSISGPENLQVDISQSDNQTRNNYKFTWSAPVGVTAEGYYYSVNTVPNTQNATFTSDSYTDYEAFATQPGLNTFYVVTKDNNGNIGWSNFSQVSFTCNTAAPGIPDSVMITDSSNRDSQRWQLTINWDQPTTVTPDFNGYVVERSTDGQNYTQIATTSSQTTGYLDTNLSNSTTYYYKVRAKDNTGNISAQSSEVSKMPTGRFTTPPNIIGQPKVELQATKVIVDWTTDRASDSFVQIGTDTNYGMTQGQLESTHSHKVVASGLQPGTTYHYRTMWRDSDGNIGYSNDATFRTQDAPGISEVSVSDIRLNSVIISWKTTTVSTSKIFYGKTNTYGKVAEDKSSSQVTTHTIKLDGLDHSSFYHFKIQGTDVDGNVLSSDDYSFETLTYPKISDLKLEQQGNEATSTVKITWKTNVPTSSSVDYIGAGVSKEAAKSLLETTHSMVISNLRDNTQYSFVVRGRDAFGNEASSETLNFKTAFDTRAPEVSDITVETSIVGFGTDAKGQVIISWETDELSTSQIEYGLGVNGDYTQTTQEDTSLTTTHVVVISGLKPSSSYHFRVVSRDQAGNTARSEDNTILTEQASSSVLDVVINSLRSTLGWLFGALNR